MEEALATKGIYDQLHHHQTASKQQQRGNKQDSERDSGVNASDQKASGAQGYQETSLDESESIVLNSAANHYFLVSPGVACRALE